MGRWSSLWLACDKCLKVHIFCIIYTALRLIFYMFNTKLVQNFFLLFITDFISVLGWKNQIRWFFKAKLTKLLNHSLIAAHNNHGEISWWSLSTLNIVVIKPWQCGITRSNTEATTASPRLLWIHYNFDLPTQYIEKPYQDATCAPS